MSLSFIVVVLNRIILREFGFGEENEGNRRT